MLRDLQSFITNVDAGKKAAVAVKRGTFVEKNEANGTFVLPDDVTELYLVDRDTVVTKDLAMSGLYSDYDADQETINAGEFAGLIALQRGVRKATSEYSASLVDADVVAGKYLSVGITAGADQGKLVASATATQIKSCGWYMDNGHKLLAFEIVK